MTSVGKGSVIGRFACVSSIMSAALAVSMIPAVADQLGWLIQFGTISFDNATSVAAHGGEVYVAGATSGVFDGTNAGSQDIYIRSYDSHGNLRWTRQFGTPGMDRRPAGRCAHTRASSSSAASSVGPFLVTNGRATTTLS